MKNLTIYHSFSTFPHILYKNLDLRDPYHDMSPLSNQRRSEQRLATLAPRSVFGCFQPEEAFTGYSRDWGIGKTWGDLVMLRGIPWGDMGFNQSFLCGHNHGYEDAMI